MGKKNVQDATLKNNRARIADIAALKKRIQTLEGNAKKDKPVIEKMRRLLAIK